MQLDWNQAAELTRLLKRKEKKDTDIGSVIGGIIGVLFTVVVFLVVGVPLLIYAVWAHAYVIQHLWGWFITPVFKGLPALSLPQCWGLAIIVAYLTHVTHTCKSEDERTTSQKVSEIIILFLRPWIVLGIGYVCAHYFLKIV